MDTGMDVDRDTAEDFSSLYIDFDAFFANVEKQIEPAIRNGPVGVTALDTQNEILITFF